MLFDLIWTGERMSIDHAFDLHWQYVSARKGDPIEHSKVESNTPGEIMSCKQNESKFRIRDSGERSTHSGIRRDPHLLAQHNFDETVLLPPNSTQF